MFRILKAILFWGYARNTWQYDVLCVLILAFIFLTPKSWFENGELRLAQQHQNMSITTPLLVTPGIITEGMSQSEVEQRVRQLTQRADTTVVGIRPRYNAQGQILVFEVDIR